jgi:beta-lactamase regulating signal transducer with metallopeptidase domain
MIATYSVRLAILCFASFFLIHLALSLLSLKLFPRIARATVSMPPQLVSNLLILLRLAPASLSIFAVLFLCMPSYLRYEGNSTTEEIGWLCLVPACMGFLICLVALSRTIRAAIQSSSLSKRLRRAKDANSWYLNREVQEFPSLGLVGLLKPKIVVSPRVLETLTTEQFHAALEHERAHGFSRDNFKRLLILLAPNPFPFVRSFRAMEGYWDRYAELSADDFATRGQPSRAIALAEALIKLARLEGSQAPPPLVSGLFAAQEGLNLRVERLLRLEPAAEKPTRLRTLLAGPCLLLAIGAFVFPQLQVFHGVYRLLESLLH